MSLRLYLMVRLLARAADVDRLRPVADLLPLPQRFLLTWSNRWTSLVVSRKLWSSASIRCTTPSVFYFRFETVWDVSGVVDGPERHRERLGVVGPVIGPALGVPALSVTQGLGRGHRQPDHYRVAGHAASSCRACWSAGGQTTFVSSNRPVTCRSVRSVLPFVTSIWHHPSFGTPTVQILPVHHAGPV